MEEETKIIEPKKEKRICKGCEKEFETFVTPDMDQIDLEFHNKHCYNEWKKGEESENIKVYEPEAKKKISKRINMRQGSRKYFKMLDEIDKLFKDAKKDKSNSLKIRECFLNTKIKPPRLSWRNPHYYAITFRPNTPLVYHGWAREFIIKHLPQYKEYLYNRESLCAKK